MSSDNLLSIHNLSLEAACPLLLGLDLEIMSGDILALVGESGSGKSLTALSVMGLLPSSIRIQSGEIIFKDNDLIQLTAREWQKIRGKSISMVFQESMSALNPLMKIGRQIEEMFRFHRCSEKREARTLALESLKQVRIHDPEKVIEQYPHELSGGMRQRVMIALALAGNPDLLICDEPTTALDVTVQTDILDLIKDIRDRQRIGVLFITHDLSVVAHVADRVAVLYSGLLVEETSTTDLFQNPRHPYTRALLSSQPSRGIPGKPLPVIPGQVPSPSERPPGCPFTTRCTYSEDSCHREIPSKVGRPGGHYRCILEEIPCE